ncbi:unnamed protein product [Owenia fusiformis]|uniref:G-protein coupled receptors family 1 profile domain-containing protein n=1 Tax=Owenia fusiformis TaxID=6347 RepID=A0A8S4NTI3_OWEFU|nr:unnamed protein product [Owenia fusiformis]
MEDVLHNIAENSSHSPTLDDIGYQPYVLSQNDINSNSIMNVGANHTLDVSNTTFNDTNRTIYTIPTVDLQHALCSGLPLGILILMTVGGNVLVLLAVFVNSHLRSTTNYFIVNLAIADLLLGLTVLPFSASLEVIKAWVFGRIFCDIWAAIDVMCCTASIMTLCVISIDRYIGVTRPLQHSTIITEKRALMIVVLVWILAAVISIAPLAGWKEPPPENPYDCGVTKQIGYVIFSVSGSFYIPLFIIISVYLKIYREALIQSKFLKTGVKTQRNEEFNSEITLRIHSGGYQVANTAKRNNNNRQNHSFQSSSSSSEGSNRKHYSRNTVAGKEAKFKREKKAAKTLGIVVGVFIMCWFPFFFVLPLSSLCQGACEIPDWLFKIIFWLGYCNSMCNPIIYAASSREFKRAFIRILHCQFRRRPRLLVQDMDFNSSSSTGATSNSTMMRFETIRRLTLNFKSRRGNTFSATIKTPTSRNKINKQKRYSSNRHGSTRRIELESPLASLKLLQEKRKTQPGTFSDDDSAANEITTDDERSEVSLDVSASASLDLPRRNPHVPKSKHSYGTMQSGSFHENSTMEQSDLNADKIVYHEDIVPAAGGGGATIGVDIKPCKQNDPSKLGPNNAKRPQIVIYKADQTGVNWL